MACLFCDSKTRAWFDARPGAATLERDQRDLRDALQHMERDVLIQEIIALRGDLDDLYKIVNGRR